MRLRAISAVCGGLLGSVALADPVLIYQTDFQSGVGSEWSSNTHLSSAPTFTKFAGRYSGNEYIMLTLETVLPPLGDGVITPPNDGEGNGDGGGGGGGGDDVGGDIVEYTLTFDIYAIDSWDGSSASFGPDTFRVSVNGGIKFNETIANQHQNQTMREPDVGREQIGYEIYDDAIYRDVSVSYTLPADTEFMKIKFRSLGLQSMNDESWGIDNVRVSYEIVPAPGTSVLAGVGLALLARRRRR